VVDYFDNTTTNYYTFRFYEVAKNFTKLDHIFAMATWIVDAKWWARLPRRSGRHREGAAKYSSSFRNCLPRPTMLRARRSSTCQSDNRKDKTPWQKAMAPVWSQYSVKIPTARS